MTTGKPTATLKNRGWLRLVGFLLFGFLLGGLAAYRHSPVFATTDRILLELFQEPEPAIKDQYALFLYWRANRLGRSDQAKALLPMTLPALVRGDDLSAFNTRWQSLSPSEKRSPAVQQSLLNCVTILLTKGNLLEAQRLLDDNTDLFQENETIKRVYLRHRDFLAMAKYLRSLEAILIKMERLADQPDAPAARSALSELSPMLQAEPVLSEQDRFAFHAGFPQLDNRVAIFIALQAGIWPGLLDCCGAYLLHYVDRFQNIDIPVHIFLPSLIALQTQPARYAEWERFIKKIGPTDSIGWLCVRDFSRGLLLAASEQRSAAAALLQEGVLDRNQCGEEMSTQAKKLVADYGAIATSNAK